MIRNKLSDANDVIRIRSFMQSDIEYVISRHKTLYYAERHLSGTFSAYVDKIVYSFVHQFNPQTDCLNILECNGAPAGSIAIAKADDETAQLRFFYAGTGNAAAWVWKPAYGYGITVLP